MLGQQRLHSIPLYSQREGLSCIYCHTAYDSRHLNDSGRIYQRNGHFFPYQSRPKISEQYPDSKSEPAFLKLRERYIRKYYKNDPIQEYIERGKRLFFGTLRIRQKSSKNCSSCHNPEEIAGINGEYPKYVPIVGKIINLEDMQNYCIVNHLGGEAFAPSSVDALSLSAYINSIGKNAQ